MNLSWTTILQSVIATAIGGLVVFFVSRSRGWWSKAKAKHETRPADGKKFTLLVAEFEGDDDKKQTGHVVAELEKQFPPRGEASLYIIPYPDVLSIGRGERSAALEAAEKKGRAWLTEKHGDVLIWGEVADKNKVLRLRFVTPRDGSAAKPYSLNEKLELPWARTQNNLGAALSTLGEREGQMTRLEEAATAYREALIITSARFLKFLQRRRKMLPRRLERRAALRFVGLRLPLAKAT